MEADNDRDLFAVINVFYSISLEKKILCEEIAQFVYVGPSSQCVDAVLQWNSSSKGRWAEAKIIEFYLTKDCRAAEKPRPSEALGFFQTQLDHDQLSADWALINQSLLFQSVFTPKDKNRFPLCAVHDKFMTIHVHFLA